MKIDRLISITFYLLNRETVSASQLALQFEVSKRTIQRDIDVLNQAGIPIVSTYGAEGGYSIIDGFKLVKQTANLDDYLNIITALKGLESAYGGKKVSATLDKMLTVIKIEKQRIFIDLSSVRESICVGQNLWIIEKAIDERKLLKINYTNAENFSYERIVEPLALSYRWYAWYLFAFCPQRNAYRLFKLPRISCLETTPGFFSREHGDAEKLMQNHMKSDNRRYCVKVRRGSR